MANADTADELHPQSDAETAHHPATSPYIPDLAAVPANELRKLTEMTVVPVEGNGDLYAPSFRELQVREEKYFDFHNGVVRVIRNKHHEQVKRCTDYSVRHLTDLVLRAFGYIVWSTGSEWLIDEDELDEGEARLVYRKGRNQVPDSRYGSSSLEALNSSKTNKQSLLLTVP